MSKNNKRNHGSNNGNSAPTSDASTEETVVPSSDDNGSGSDAKTGEDSPTIEGIENGDETHSTTANSDTSNSGDSDTGSEGADLSDANDGVQSGSELSETEINRPQRPSASSASARRAQLQSAASELSGEDAKAGLPDDVDKLKELVIAHKRTKDRLSEEVQALEMQARVDAPKLKRLATAEAALEVAASQSESRWKPVVGMHTEGHGITPDTVTLACPIGPFRPGKRVRVWVKEAEIVVSEDGVEAFKPISGITELNSTQMDVRDNGTRYYLQS